MLSCLYLALLQRIILGIIGEEKELLERIIGKFKSILCSFLYVYEWQRSLIINVFSAMADNLACLCGNLHMYVHE